MWITYDPRADALAIELRDVPVVRTCEVTDAVNVDLGKDGQVVVVEILNVRKGLGVEVLQHLGLNLGGIQWQPEPDSVHATNEAARLVGVSRQYLSKMAREGKIPARRSGRDWLFYRSGLVEFFGPERVGEQAAPYCSKGASGTIVRQRANASGTRDARGTQRLVPPRRRSRSD